MTDMGRSYSAQGPHHQHSVPAPYQKSSAFPQRPGLTRLHTAPAPSALPTIAPPIPGENNIKCSDCGAWVDLMTLGEHRCGGVASTRQQPRISQGDRWRRPDLRLEVPAAGKRIQAFGDRLSPRGPPEGFNPSSPLTPVSHPSSPTNAESQSELSRSFSSTSSVSSSGSKLPFFERYQKLVGNGAAPYNQGTGTLPRSNPTDNLHSMTNTIQTPPLTPSPAFAPHVSRSPSPSIASFRGLPAAPPSRQDSDLPYTNSSVGSRSSNFTSQPSGTPASSVQSNSPPRSQRISMTDSQATPPSRHPGNGAEQRRVGGGHSTQGSVQLRGDSRTSRTLPASMSTPTKLASHGQQGYFDRQPPQERGAPPANGGGGLDACLEDLRLLANEDEDVFHHEGDTNTPRSTQRRPMASSQSTPALSASGPDPESRGSGAPNRCVTCRRGFRSSDEIQRAGDGQPFCRPCYAERFLPKCRKCSRPIEGGAVTSSDGKVLGKYHPSCFSCFTCSAQFTSKEFYVFDHKPYCQLHYHELNGSLCTDRRCGEPIEGPCVSLVGEEKGGGDHPECFKCYTCQVPLPEHHYVLGGLPYCERHVERESPRSRQLPARPDGVSNSSSKTSRAKKRQTIITR